MTPTLLFLLALFTFLTIVLGFTIVNLDEVWGNLYRQAETYLLMVLVGILSLFLGLVLLMIFWVAFDW